MMIKSDDTNEELRYVRGVGDTGLGGTVIARTEVELGCTVCYAVLSEG